MKKPFITIFTPTFNRSGQLKRLYRSLVRQSNRRFVWLIVDDGSTDDTGEWVAAWRAEGRLDIRYFFQENQGKHVAHNTAVNNTDTEYFYCVDSDDELPKNAVDIICKAVSGISDKPGLAGVIGKKRYRSGGDMCSEFPRVAQASIRDMYRVYGLKGELALVFRTRVLKEFLFPVFGSEKFLGENAVLNLISVRYKMLLLNRVIYLGEYLPDGYSRNLSQIHRQNPTGYLYCLAQEIELARTPRELKRAYAGYISGCWRVGHRISLDIRCIIANIPEAFVIYMKMLIKEWVERSKLMRSVLKRLFRGRFMDWG